MNLFTDRLYEQHLIQKHTPTQSVVSKVKELSKRVKFKDIQNLLIIAVTLTFFLGITNFAAKTEDIADNVLRLHILANSDSEEDQALKLKVRDRILATGYDTFSNAENAEQAEERIIADSDKLIKAAQEVIEEEGYNYDVTLEITDESFPTRTYDNVTLPAGEYRAVRLVIGKGEGHNWWCVMFPTLCLPGASDTDLDAVLTEDEIELVESDPEVDVRFKIAEIFEGIRVKAKEIF